MLRKDVGCRVEDLEISKAENLCFENYVSCKNQTFTSHSLS